MKVFNLTDVPTEKLQQFGLVNQSIALGEVLLHPGTSMEIPPDHVALQGGLQHFVDVGAVSLGEAPDSYRGGKEQGKTKPLEVPPPAETKPGLDDAPPMKKKKG